jgi:hypothetical protein
VNGRAVPPSAEELPDREGKREVPSPGAFEVRPELNRENILYASDKVSFAGVHEVVLGP